MRLLIATPLYPPEIGGPATYAKALEEGLPALGVEVELVKFGDVRHLPRIIRHYVYYWRLRRAAKKADVVLALDPVSTGYPAMKAAKRAKKKFMVKIVGDYAWEQGQQRFGITASLDDFVKTRHVPWGVRVLRRTQTRVARCADKIIVPSEYLKTILVAWGIEAKKIEIIYNAIPFEAPGTLPAEVAALKEPIIVTAGRLVPWKNMDGVIEAIGMLRKRDIEASLIIVGDGPEHRQLAAKAHHELKQGVVLTGALSHGATLAVLKHASIFVLNSTYEGLSHFLIEAQMLGVPTIATRVGGNPEVIRDGETGVLVPVNATKSLATALEELLTNGGRRARIGLSAKEASARFALPTMLERTKTLLQTLL